MWKRLSSRYPHLWVFTYEYIITFLNLLSKSILSNYTLKSIDHVTRNMELIVFIVRDLLWLIEEVIIQALKILIINNKLLLLHFWLDNILLFLFQDHTADFFFFTRNWILSGSALLNLGWSFLLSCFLFICASLSLKSTVDVWTMSSFLGKSLNPLILYPT